MEYYQLSNVIFFEFDVPNKSFIQVHTMNDNNYNIMKIAPPDFDNFYSKVLSGPTTQVTTKEAFDLKLAEVKNLF